MTIQEAYNFFESSKSETTNKSEIKVYEKFLHILSGLKNRTFSKDQIHFIEKELDRLNLKSNPENRKKHLKKALTKFEKYLKDTFSLTSKGHYTHLFITLGVLFGVVVGVLLGEHFEKSLGISFGISIGMLIGTIIGHHMDSQAKAAGNML
jgi:F0F1-type ATP synthase assembly protein I